jgi:hypothetical protein
MIKKRGTIITTCKTNEIEKRVKYELKSPEFENGYLYSSPLF